MARIFENPVVIVSLIVLIIVLFGAKRLPDVAKSLGSSMKIFKKEVKDLRNDDDQPAGTTQADAPAPQSTQTPPAASPPQGGTAAGSTTAEDGRTQQPGSASPTS